MPQKYIIANCGKPNQGKSESLNKLINVVKQAGQATLVHEEWQYDGGTKRETDRFVKFECSNVKIAIITQGDKSDSALADCLRDSAAWEADVIVCSANVASQINNLPELKDYERTFFENPKANYGVTPYYIECEAYNKAFAYGTVAIIETLYGINLI